MHRSRRGNGQGAGVQTVTHNTQTEVKTRGLLMFPKGNVGNGKEMGLKGILGKYGSSVIKGAKGRQQCDP